jgi:hypothetical protein
LHLNILEARDKMLRLNKRGQEDLTVNQGVMILRMMLMIFVAMSIVILMTKYMALSADVGTAERAILLNRLIISPGCLAYTDSELQRPSTGIINLTRLNSIYLDSCMHYGESNDHAAANLSLTIIGTGAKAQAYYNEVGYALLKPRAGMDGPGGSKLLKDTRYVLVMDDNKLSKGLLTIELVTPNS